MAGRDNCRHQIAGSLTPSFCHAIIIGTSGVHVRPVRAARARWRLIIAARSGRHSSTPPLTSATCCLRFHLSAISRRSWIASTHHHAVVWDVTLENVRKSWKFDLAAARDCSIMSFIHSLVLIWPTQLENRHTVQSTRRVGWLPDVVFVNFLLLTVD